MAAPKGNQFWKVRSSHGAKPKFATPEALWSACQEYFEWVEKHPLYETKMVQFQGEATLKDVPKMRVMTLGGLTLFLDVEFSTWVDWRENRKDLDHIIKQVERIIYENKFTGAAADLLNANIIARDLGLADKQKIDTTLKVEAVDVTFHRAPYDASDA